MSRIAELEAMLESQPNDPFLIYALAREYESQQDTMQALLMYEHLVTNYPDYVATYYHYARLLYIAGNRNEAENLLTSGIASGERNKDFHATSEMRGLLNSWHNDDDED